MDQDPSDKQTSRPVSKSKRFFKLAGMTASVAGSYAKSKIKSVFKNAEESAREQAESYQESGERIAKTLGELKGAAMKIGQMASVASDVLPKELSSALTSLQKEAPPMSFEVIADQIEREFGARPEVLFNHFDPEPFAAASIGQVHRAQVDDGREVVVKIQYPGVDNSVDSDLAHLKLALRASGLVKMNRKAFNNLFDEIRARLHEELDYTLEADNVRTFREFHKDDDFVHIPEVVGERSSKRVLTLTYVPGDDINDLDKLSYTQEARNTIGENLFKLTLKQLFTHQTIHADPNPANYAFRPDGSIVLYDFGCIKRVKPEIADAYRSTLYCAVKEDYDGVEQGLLNLGARDPDGPPIEAAYYKKWRDLLLLPFTTGEPFDYGTSTIHDEAKKMVPEALKRITSFQPAVEIVFIDRVVIGHYGNLRIVRSRGQFFDLVEPYLEPEDAS